MAPPVRQQVNRNKEAICQLYADRFENNNKRMICWKNRFPEWSPKKENIRKPELSYIKVLKSLI